MADPGRAPAEQRGGAAVEPRSSRGLWLPPLIAGATVLLILALLILRTRLNLLPWGCYRFHYRSVFGVVFVAAVFTSLPWAVRWLRGPATVGRKLLLIVPLGMLLQWAVVLAEGRGVRPLMEKLYETGHVEFVRVALTPLPPDLAARYEELIPERRWVFPQSKPPGALMVYRAAVVVAAGRAGHALERVFFGAEERLDALTHVRQRIAAVLFVVMTLLTFLTLVPLYLLGRDLCGERAAVAAVLLYLSAPVVLVVTMHLDGSLYPLLGTTSLWLGFAGARRGRLWLVALGGAVLSTGLFTTFGLLPLAPLAVVLCAAHPLTQAHTPLAARLKQAALLAGLFVGGLVLVHLVFVVALHYNPFTRFAGARMFHYTWKRDIPLAPWLWGNLVQFALWLGLPLAAAAAAAVGGAVRRGWRTSAGLLALGFLALLVITDFIGDAKSEVMRLWLFWVPVIALLAAGRIVDWEAEQRRPVLAVALGLQLVYVFAFKALYDCY